MTHFYVVMSITCLSSHI